MAALQGTYVVLWLRAIGLGGLEGHVARCQGNRLGAQDRSSSFLTIPFERTVITLQTPAVTHGPRVCICLAHGKQRRSNSTTSWYLSCGNIFSIVLWRSKPDLRFLYSYYYSSSRNSSRCSPLLSLTSPPRPLRRRPPKTLLEHPPKRTTFYMLLSRRKLTKCVYYSHLSVAFVVEFPGLHKTTKQSAAEPRYITFGAQNFLRNRDTWYELLGLDDEAMCTAAVSYVELLIPKLYFEAKTTVFTPFFCRSTDQPVFLVL